MPTQQRYRSLVAQRIGGYQSLTVSLAPDVTSSEAQRLILSTDLYDTDRPASSFGDAWAWVGRYGDGRRIKRSSYRSTSYSYLISPTTGASDEAFTLSFYGYGTTGSINLTGIVSASTRASTIETAITSISGLASATVSAISTTEFKITLPQSTITVEISNDNGSVTCGIGSIEATRPFRSALPIDSQVELHTKVPVHNADGLVGLNALINQALARLSFIDRLQFTADDTDTLVFDVDEDWLTTRPQIIQAYLPVSRSYAVTYTPPVSGSFTLTLDLGKASNAQVTQTYTVSASALQTAIQAAQSTIGHQANATVTSALGVFTITVPETLFAAPSLTASTGTVGTATIARNDTQYRFDGWRFIFDGEKRSIELNAAFGSGETWELEVYRPCHTWVCPQTDYLTEGTLWQSSSVGLTNDLDQAFGDEDAVVAITHYLVCRQMATQGPSSEVKYWQAEAARAAQIAAQLKLFDIQRNTERAPRDALLSWERGRQSKGFFGR